MCLIALAYRSSPDYPLMVCANRDESHLRPAAAASWWQDNPDVLAGRDLEAGGTWLAVDRHGKFAAVTNLRTAGEPTTAPMLSRGLLVSHFIGQRITASAAATTIAGEADRYGDFNLLLYDGADLRYVSNRAPDRGLDAGIHALSNAPLGVEWPKVARARQGLTHALSDPDPADKLLALLRETRPTPADEDIGRTSIFRKDPAWGTRCSTVVLIDARGRVRFTERRFEPEGEWNGEDTYEFRISPDR